MIWDEFKLLFVITDLFKPLVLLEGFNTILCKHYLDKIKIILNHKKEN